MKYSLLLSALIVSDLASASVCGRALTWSGGVLVAASLATSLPATAQTPDTGPVATQDVRKDPSSGWVAYPNFPHLEVVTNGVVNPDLVKILPNADLRERIEKKHEFYWLDSRNLSFFKPSVAMNHDVVQIPYAVSVFYKQSENRLSPNQGTIDVAGLITVNVVGTNLKATVTRFSDSWYFERWGRAVGYHADVDLAFARDFVPAQLETWLNADPARIQNMLGLVGIRPVQTKP